MSLIEGEEMGQKRSLIHLLSKNQDRKADLL